VGPGNIAAEIENALNITGKHNQVEKALGSTAQEDSQLPLTHWHPNRSFQVS